VRDTYSESVFYLLCTGSRTTAPVAHDHAVEDVDMDTRTPGHRVASRPLGNESQARRSQTTMNRNQQKTAAELERELQLLLARMNWMPEPFAPTAPQVIEHYAALLAAAREREAEAARRPEDEPLVPRWADLPSRAPTPRS